jgi:hypothetical protein
MRNEDIGGPHLEDDSFIFYNAYVPFMVSEVQF